MRASKRGRRAPTPETSWPRAPRAARLIAPVVALALAVTTPAMASPGDGQPAAAAEGWWHAGYLVDYGLVAVGAAAYGLTSLLDTPAQARLGPVYDAANPASVLKSSHAGAIGKPYAEEGEGETVPTAWAGVGLGVGFVWLVAQEGIPVLTGAQPSARRLHDTAVGYLEGLALTLGVVESLKMGVGRLRPDFQARALRYHCHTEPVAGLDCAGVAPLDEDPERARWLLNDGRKSFPSGHAATSMFFASYLGYAIGGWYVWSDDATFTSRSFGLFAQTVLLGVGAFTAASRFDDGRHHLGDIVTGGAIGLGMATFAYWRRFDSRGRLRTRGTQRLTLQLSPGPGDAGLAVQGWF